MLWIMTPPASVHKARYRNVSSAPEDGFWRILHRIADKAMAGLAQVVNDILSAVGLSIPQERLRHLVTAQDQRGIEDELHAAWDRVGQRGLQEHLGPRLRAVALDAAEATPLAEVRVAFNVRDAEAIAAIDAMAGEHITAISQTTREAIQGIVRRAFESGTPLTQQLSEIEQLIGLTERQAASLARFRQGLVEAKETPERIEALVRQRAVSTRRLRAERIARSEGITMVHAGQQERWQQAVREGVLDPARLRRFPIVTPDDRLCPHCARIPGMNPDGRRLDEPFATPYGPQMHPAFHVLCRCSVSARIA